MQISKIKEIIKNGEALTSRKCEKLFGVSRPISAGDFRVLVKTGLARRVGRGRSTHYILDTKSNR